MYSAASCRWFAARFPNSVKTSGSAKGSGERLSTTGFVPNSRPFRLFSQATLFAGNGLNGQSAVFIIMTRTKKSAAASTIAALDFKSIIRSPSFNRSALAQTGHLTVMDTTSEFIVSHHPAKGTHWLRHLLAGSFMTLLPPKLLRRLNKR